MGLAQFLSRHFFTRKVIARAVVEVSSCQQTRFEVVDADADADADVMVVWRRSASEREALGSLEPWTEIVPALV